MCLILLTTFDDCSYCSILNDGKPDGGSALWCFRLRSGTLDRLLAFFLMQRHLCGLYLIVIPAHVIDVIYGYGTGCTATAEAYGEKKTYYLAYLLHLLFLLQKLYHSESDYLSNLFNRFLCSCSSFLGSLTHYLVEQFVIIGVCLDAFTNRC